MRLAESPKALRALFLVAFAESSFFPIPPDPMLVPMVLANRRRAFTFAAVCTLGSVLGGIFGYYIGATFEEVGIWIITAFRYDPVAVKAWFTEHGVWIILVKGLTPIPYKIITIMSGMLAFDLKIFIAASIVTRGARFFLVAALLYFFGEPIRTFIEKRLTLVTTLFVVLVVCGIIGVKYLF